MKPLFFAALAVGLLSLSGCVGTANNPAPQATLAAAAGRSLAITQRERPNFGEMKASNMMAGWLGGAVGGAIAGASAAKSGKELIAQFDIPDPAVQVASDLSRYLAEQFKVQPHGQTAITVKSAETSELAAAAKGQADLLLDIQTTNWSCTYLPTQWKKYRVLYHAKLRLIDVPKRELLAEGYFTWKTPDGTHNPTHEELFANNAAVLRQQLDEARKAATDYFRTEILARR